MDQNIKIHKNKTQTKKNRIIKMSQGIPTNTFTNVQSFNIKEKDNEYINKKRYRHLSDKKKYKVGKFLALHKKKSSHDSIFNSKIRTKNGTNKKENVLSGINWKKIKALIPTKTMAEVKSFAKNYFYKMKSCKDDNLGIDFTSNSINNLKDIIDLIKSRYPNFNESFLVLKKMSNKNVKIKKFKKIHKKRIKSQKNNNLENNQKNEFNLLENEKINYLSSNENTNIINNNISNNNKYILFNTNFLGNEILNNNNNFSYFQISLNNSLVYSIENNLLFNYILDSTNKLLNYFLFLNTANNPYVDCLYQRNNLLLCLEI